MSTSTDLSISAILSFNTMRVISESVCSIVMYTCHYRMQYVRMCVCLYLLGLESIEV